MQPAIPLPAPRQWYAAIALSLLTFLSACGGGSPTRPPATTPTQAPLPMPLPMPLPGQLPADPAAARMWTERVLRTHQAVRAYESLLAFFQKSGREEIRGMYDLRGKQPRLLRIHILEGASKGAKLLWQGGSTIKVRAAGLLGAIPIDLDLTDKRLVSIRGYTLAQTDLQSLLAMLSNPVAQTRFLGEQGGFGYLEVRGNHLLPGCVSMVVRIDARTGYVRTIEMSDPREVVFRMELRTFRPVADVSLDI